MSSKITADNITAGFIGTTDKTSTKIGADSITRIEIVPDGDINIVGEIVNDSGKKLSTNDYTTNEQTKLSNIAERAQVNVIEKITVGGVAQTITDKTVDLTIPNPDLSAYYTKTETNAKITPTTLVVYKNGINGNFYPRTFKWPTDKTISSIQLMSNCSNISLSIGGITYDKITAINVLLPANTEMTINDLSINAGFNYGEALIIF
jgi:hypothetical protein